MSILLRTARTTKGLTQAEVATAIGRDQATVSKYEAGRARVDVDTAPRLAEVLGLTVLEVLYGEDGPSATAEPDAKAA